MSNTEKSIGLAVREHIAAKLSDGRDFCLRDFDKMVEKMKITSTQVRTALTNEVNVRSIVETGRYKPADHPKEITHYKLISMAKLLRQKDAESVPPSDPPLLQAVLDAIIHKRMQKKASLSRARCAA